MINYFANLFDNDFSILTSELYKSNCFNKHFISFYNASTFIYRNTSNLLNTNTNCSIDEFLKQFYANFFVLLQNKFNLVLLNLYQFTIKIIVYLIS